MTDRRTVCMGLLLAGLTLSVAGCQRTPPESPEFHLLALAEDGVPLEQGEGSVACLLDRNTALLWELRSAQPGLRDRRHTYTWYFPVLGERRGDPGQEDGGQCEGARCDTSGYVEAINAMRLCGFDDWRVPTRAELATLRDPRATPQIAAEFAAAVVADEYWSADTYRGYAPGAWTWNMRHGHDRVDWKSEPKGLMLVRGGPPPGADDGAARSSGDTQQ